MWAVTSVTVDELARTRCVDSPNARLGRFVVSERVLVAPAVCVRRGLKLLLVAGREMRH
jgi:hypothetical protein